MLREEIEKIECSQCNNEPKGRDCPVRNSCLYGTGRVDRICIEIGKVAKGMPRVNCRLDPTINRVDVAYDNLTIDRQLKECQAYWQKELGNVKP